MTPTERKAFEALRESHRKLVKAGTGMARIFKRFSDDELNIILGAYVAAELFSMRAALATARKLTEGAEG